MSALLALFVWSVFAPAGGWHWEHPTPQGASLTALSGDGSAVVAVGAHGSALVSSDDGATWASASTGVVADLHGVAVRGKLVIAVGDGGTILRSLDGGATYAVRPAPVAGLLSAVTIAADGVVHIATREGTTLVSRDGGDSFAAQTGTGGGGATGSAGRVVGVGGLGGAVALGGFGGISAIASPAPDVVLLGGAAGMFRSVDGGATFTAVADIAEPIGGLARDGGVIYASGGASVVYGTVNICNSCVDAGYATQSLYRSRDGGKTWEQRVIVDAPGATPPSGWIAPRPHVPPPTPPSGSSFGGFGPYHAPIVTPGFAAHDLIVAGGALYVASNGGLLRSDDGGATFSAPLPIRSDRLHASGAALITLASGGDLARSTDRGATWANLSSSLTDGGNLFAIAVLPGGRAIAVGMDGALVVRDAAGVWRKRASGLHDTRLDDVATVGDVVVIVGDRGTLLRSADGGATFRARRSHSVENLNTVWGEGDFFIAAGGDGNVIRSLDGGETWTRLTSLRQDAGIDLWGSSPDDLYMVTLNGAQLRSTDRGATWRDVGAALDGVITGVWGSGPHDVYLVGWGGLIYHSRDRGRTWHKRTSGTDLDLQQIWGRDAREIYAGGGYHSGSNGILLCSRDRGRTWRPVPLPTEATVYALGGDAHATYVVGSGAHIVARPR